MREKECGLLMWYNLKGMYDLFIFKNGHQKNKFIKDYKELYNEMLNYAITWEEFAEYQQDMFNSFEYDFEEEFDRREIKENRYRQDYVVRNNIRIIIDNEKLEYGC